MNFTTNHVGMQQAKVPCKNGYWSIIKPHAFTGQYWEVALVINEDVQEPVRFNSKEEVLAYIASKDQ